MAFDQNTRNRLQNFVSGARTLLTDEFTRQLQNDYGLDPATGEVSSLEHLTHLDDTRHQTARLLRDTLNHYQAGSPSGGPKEALNRIVREQAFTVLNRICALRMAEAREILIESIGKSYNSKGFQLYARLAGTGLGETGDAYRCYLFSLFDEFAVDLAVLFDRYSSMGRLFPRESVLLELLGKINDVEIASLWAEDETIGWIYQYFNSKEERKKMRDESQAPRNSRELAVRNQFFTPRYVVEFLTDNTLGRIWYEMTQGDTVLKDQCRYLVRRPNEIFLAAGEEISDQQSDVGGQKSEVEMTQEELLKQPVYIPHRPLKDPREIRMLDPACGSMHFGLYAFDLFEKIYEEAWDMEDSGRWMKISGQKSVGSGQRGSSEELTTEYASKEAFLRDVPRLIIEHNIHGVDIDPRAVQIAGLSLWLRAQHFWKEQNVKPTDRPQIRKSNIVCAEPMPGEKDLLREFTKNLKPRVLGQLLEIIFEKMELAGEAGSLLKIEEEIEEAVEQAREEFNKELLRRNQGEQGALFPELEAPKQQALFDFADLPDKTRFWRTAEEKILDALRDYAEHAEAGDSSRRLFIKDAAKGFAFIDLCRKRFDIVLMNPPFGEFASSTKQFSRSYYPATKNDIYGSFIERSITWGGGTSILGAITPRTWLTLTRFQGLRDFVLQKINPEIIVDLGYDVLESMAEVAVFVLQMNSKVSTIFKPAFHNKYKADAVKSICESIFHGKLDSIVFINAATFCTLPQKTFAFGLPTSVLSQISSGNTILESYNFSVKQGIATGDNERFLRCFHELPLGSLHKIWVPYAKGGDYSVFYSPLELALWWSQEGLEIKIRAKHEYGSESRTIKNQETYFCPGLTFSLVSQAGFSVRVLPKGCIYDMGGPAIFEDGASTQDNLYTLMGWLNSGFVQYVLGFITDSRHWHVITIQALPILHLDDGSHKEIQRSVECCVNKLMNISRFKETDPFFSVPVLSTEGVKSEIVAFRKFLNETRTIVFKTIERIDIIGCDTFKVDESTVEADRERGLQQLKNNVFSEKFMDVNLVSDTLSYLAGIIFGRWDIRYAIDEKDLPDLPDPFDPLPVCPPGMLQNTDGLPAEPKDVPPDYPLRITWGGILVDDEGHNEDIVGRIREGIEVIWKAKAGDIEQEACEILGVRSLRDYFRKPAKFFADHLKRYSKSRRQAPIYWPLSTSSGSYTLWLYYHRLTDQTLYTCVNDFVEPKLAVISGQLGEIRRQKSETRGQLSSVVEKGYELLTNFEMELKDFRDELLRIAKFWKPNLNDGVQITAAPLWKLFQHKPWQKKLKQTWEKLEKGDYDWAHLAYRIWPERVIRASHKDRSYAIAHDLEDDLWEGIEDGTDRQGNPKYKWVPKVLNKQEIKELIAEKVGGNA